MAFPKLPVKVNINESLPRETPKSREPPKLDSSITLLAPLLKISLPVPGAVLPSKIHSVTVNPAPVE